MLPCNRILVATDFGPAARAALRSALKLAEGTRGTVDVLHVVKPAPWWLRVVDRDAAARVEADRSLRAEVRLNRLIARIEDGSVAVEGVVRVGTPWREILETARELEADLICLGTSDASSGTRFLGGATPEKVADGAAVQVLVTGRRALAEVARVLVPVEMAKPSASGLAFASERLPQDAELDPVYVVSRAPGGLWLWKREDGSSAVAGREILRRAAVRGADLIVAPAVARRRAMRLPLAGLTERILRGAQIPVLVLPRIESPRAAWTRELRLAPATRLHSLL